MCSRWKGLPGGGAKKIAQLHYVSSRMLPHPPTPRVPLQTDLYVNTSLSLTAAQRAFVINFTAGFTSIFTVALVLLLLPRVRTLAVELRQRHALLLQLPMQVVSGLPLARNLVGAALAEYESALGGGGFGIGDASISDLKQGSRRRSAVSVDENTTR